MREQIKFSDQCVRLRSCDYCNVHLISSVKAPGAKRTNTFSLHTRTHNPHPPLPPYPPTCHTFTFTSDHHFTFSLHDPHAQVPFSPSLHKSPNHRAALHITHFTRLLILPHPFTSRVQLSPSFVHVCSVYTSMESGATRRRKRRKKKKRNK